ncbi:MAG: sulfatase-like hydrolase/transferase [Gammaproteobacteria bacterium]|nr:sulfatase-like hydrolase/transferase [Gammaproteobacteria bacterium]NNM21133.1 sulfatase-like hydrolase/transferase [Gammaproteobacteria bacterium]
MKQIIVALTLAAISQISTAAPDDGATRPNVIVFMADDLGWNDVGYHGSNIKTPNIDALAAQAVQLEQFYVMPWCTATRAAFESGLNPARFGILSLQHPFPGRTALPPDLATLPELLRRHGYFTALVGKWHLSYSFDGGPIERGYQRAFGYLHGQMDHYTHEDQRGVTSLFRDDELISADGHMTDLIGAELRSLLQQPGQPFFINVTFSAPHYPLQAPAQFIDANAAIENPDRRLFAGMVTHMDHVIGETVKLLESRGLLTNTIIIFLSDNGGDNYFENTRDYYGGKHGSHSIMADNSPLRGAKTDVYEGGIRVPAFIHYPAVLQPRVIDQFTAVTDLLPTLLDFAEVEPPAQRDGGSLRPLLSGKPQVREPEYYWFTRSVKIPHGGGKQSAVRLGNWKLIESQRRFAWLPWRFEWPWPRFELFDLGQDPREQVNLARDHSDIADKLRGRLEEYRAEVFASYPGADGKGPDAAPHD